MSGTECVRCIGVCVILSLAPTLHAVSARSQSTILSHSQMMAVLFVTWPDYAMKEFRTWQASPGTSTQNIVKWRLLAAFSCLICDVTVWDV